MTIRILIAVLFLFNTIKIQTVWALNLPISIDKLTKPEGTEQDKRNKGNNSYALANNIVFKHNEVTLMTGICSLDCGVGLVAFLPHMILQQSYCTFWGREYHRAQDMKALIVATSSQYESGDDPLVVTSKRKSSRQRTYRNSQSKFIKFYNKLAIEYQNLHQSDAPSEQEIRELIYRANAVGLLSAKSLIKEMEKHDSFAPLRWVIITGQFEDRLLQIEAILNELKDSESVIFNELKANATLNTILQDQDPSNCKFAERLYPIFQAKINAIEDFSFAYDPKKYDGYQRI